MTYCAVRYVQMRPVGLLLFAGLWTILTFSATPCTFEESSSVKVQVPLSEETSTIGDSMANRTVIAI